MKTKPAVKKFASLLASIGLISGLALTSVSSPVNAATGGPIYPKPNIYSPLDRSTGEFTILNGGTLSYSGNAYLQSSWAGWADDPESFSAAAFNIAPQLPAGVTLVSQSWRWDASVMPFEPGCSKYETKTTSAGTEFSIASLSCKANINSLGVGFTFVLSNTSGSDKNVDLTTDSTTRLSADGVVTSGEGSAATIDLFYRLDSLTASGMTMPNEWESQPAFAFDVCLDSSLVSVGDTVTVHRVFKANGVDVPVNSGGGMADPSFDEYVFTSDGNEVDTYVLGEMDSSMLSNGGARYVAFYVNNSSKSLAGQNVVVSLDIKKDGVSVIKDSCYGGGGGGPIDTFPTLGTLSGGTAAGKGKLSNAINLPANALDASSGAFHGTTVGYNGDVYYWSTTEGEATVAHLGPTGKLKINGADLLTRTMTSEERLYSFAWYGAKRDKYVMAVGPIELTPSGSFKLYFGNLNKTGGTSSRTLAANKIHGATGICGTADLVGIPFIISAPTATPVLSVRCQPEMYMYGDISYSMFGTLANDGATGSKITSFGTPKATEAKPCVYSALGVNRNAKGKSSAIVIYTALGEKTTEDGPPEPTCAGKLASSRSLISISGQAKVQKKKTFVSGPFGTVEPSRIFISPAKAANSWLAVATEGGFNAPPTVGKAYTIPATLVPKAAKTAPKLLAGDGFAAPGMMVEDGLTPITTLKNGQWLVYRTQRAFGPSSSLKVAIAKYNPATGAITNGEVLTAENLNMSSKYINGFATNSTGVLAVYLLTEAGKYKVATWKSFTS